MGKNIFMKMENTTWKKEKIIVIFILIIGLFMSVAIPTWQTPDEYTHVRQIGESVGVNDFAEKIEKNVAIKRIEGKPDKKVNFKQQKKAMVQHPKYQRKEMLPQKISLSILKHFPAMIGIYFGIIIGLPAFWVLQLGELSALLFYCLVCYEALKIMPVKKEAMVCFMLLPMGIQQAASVNYDAVVIPLSYFFISYIFYLKYSKEMVGLKECVKVIGLIALIAYIKMPYAVLILLVFMIPLKKIKIKVGTFEINGDFLKKIRIPAIILGGIVAIAMVYKMKNMWMIQIVYGYCREWERGLYLLKATGATWGEFLFVSTVGNFGWLDTPILLGVAISVFVAIFVFSLMKEEKNANEKMCVWDILVLIGTAIIGCLLITIALTDHSLKVTLFGTEKVEYTYEIREALYQIPYIGGLQGRYYLPIASLFFLPIPAVVKVTERKKNILMMTVQIILYVYIFGVIVLRYWIR